MRRCGQPGVGGLVDAVGFDLVDKQGVGRGGQDIDGGEHQRDLGLHAPFCCVSSAFPVRRWTCRRACRLGSLARWGGLASVGAPGRAACRGPAWRITSAQWMTSAWAECEWRCRARRMISSAICRVSCGTSCKRACAPAKVYRAWVNGRRKPACSPRSSSRPDARQRPRSWHSRVCHLGYRMRRYLLARLVAPAFAEYLPPFGDWLDRGGLVTFRRSEFSLRYLLSVLNGISKISRYSDLASGHFSCLHRSGARQDLLICYAHQLIVFGDMRSAST